MPELRLTESQKELLRSLAPGLEDGSVEAEWILVPGDDTFISIYGISGELEVFWIQNAKFSDFRVFVKQGLFIQDSDYNYTLDTQAIIDAVNKNFLK